MADALSLSQIQACEVGSESTQVTVGDPMSCGPSCPSYVLL